MSHTTLRSGYEHLVDRLNRFPQGAPPSDTLYKILAILFSEREAELVALLPIKPFTAEKASPVWKMDLTAGAEGAGRTLASRAILVDVEHERQNHLHPAAAHGRFLRVLDDAPARRRRPESAGGTVLPVSERRRGFHPHLFVRGETQLGRSSSTSRCFRRRMPCTCWITNAPARSSTPPRHRGIGVCYCRHKMMHVGQTATPRWISA